MDPITLILTALGAGAQSVVSDVIKDTYTGLKTLIQRKFAGKPSAEVALTEHETDPQTWQAPLKKALVQEHVEQDTEIIRAAQALLDQINQQPHGAQHIQQAIGNYIAQADRNSTASVNVNVPKEG